MTNAASVLLKFVDLKSIRKVKSVGILKIFENRYIVWLCNIIFAPCVVIIIFAPDFAHPIITRAAARFK